MSLSFRTITNNGTCKQYHYTTYRKQRGRTDLPNRNADHFRGLHKQWNDIVQFGINTGTFTNNATLTYKTGDMVNNGFISGTIGRITQTTGELVNSATGTITYTAAVVITFGTGNFTNLNSGDNVDFGTGAVTISGTAATQRIVGFTTGGGYPPSRHQIR